jgi:hypothetical protein
LLANFSRFAPKCAPARRDRHASQFVGLGWEVSCDRIRIHNEEHLLARDQTSNFSKKPQIWLVSHAQLRVWGSASRTRRGRTSVASLRVSSKLAAMALGMQHMTAWEVWHHPAAAGRCGSSSRRQSQRPPSPGPMRVARRQRPRRNWTPLSARMVKRPRPRPGRTWR